MYDRREKEYLIYGYPPISFSDCLNNLHLRTTARNIISFHEESYLTTMVKEHWHVNVFVFISFDDAKGEKYDILVGCYLFYVWTKSKEKNIWHFGHFDSYLFMLFALCLNQIKGEKYMTFWKLCVYAWTKLNIWIYWWILISCNDWIKWLYIDCLIVLND